MSTSLFSLIFAGVLGVGTFAGTLQQNLAHPQKTEYDLLFDEIEKDIKEFAKKHSISEENLKEIKCVSSQEQENCKKGIEETEIKDQSKNTLSVWTDIWMGLLSGYIDKLWRGNSRTPNDNLEFRVFSEDDKKEALVSAESNVKKEKDKFKEKLEDKDNKIEEIYQKMKEFLQIMKLPKKYNNSVYENTPYEEYIKGILEK